jgi:transcriptional regulator with XRE-family HTH domain
MAWAFGSQLRRLREAKKLTLQQVADAVGCTKAYIWELEMRPGQRPSAERIHLLSKVLGVAMEDLMGEDSSQMPQATADDVVFFRAYAAMAEVDKQRYQQVVTLMFGPAQKHNPEHSADNKSGH